MSTAIAVGLLLLVFAGLVWILIGAVTGWTWLI